MAKKRQNQTDLLKALTDFDIFDDYDLNNDEIIVVCKQCGGTWSTKPRQVNSAIEICPHCGRIVVVVGCRTVHMQRPDLLKYFVDPFEACIYNATSTALVEFKCPDCGFTKSMQIAKITGRRFACDVCHDGVSFANKFIYYLLRQLQPEWWETEWHPEWATKYSYDAGFSLNGKYYAVEMHGGQHYSGKHWSDVWWEDQQRRDQEKIILAQQANVHLITINCSKTNFEYVQQNILGSELAALFNLSNIDWDKIAWQCQSNLMKQVCDIYNANPSLSRQEIGDMVGLAAVTVYVYLKDGNALGWCDYRPLLISEMNSKAVNVYDIKHILIGTYPSIQAAKRELEQLNGVKFDHNCIAKRLKNNNPLLLPYKNYYFELAN